MEEKHFGRTALKMKNVYIYCEGQTEEAFINELLSPYFANLGIWIWPIVCTTKRTKKEKFRGGVSDYFKIKNELAILCKEHKNELVTTMFDYYAMPSNTPQIDCTASDLHERMSIIENAITTDVAQENCFFGLMLHEFESLLFSNPSAFSKVTDDATVGKIQEIRNEFPSPEHINNSVSTAPSKRLESLISNYPKVRNGIIVSKEIGIDCILRECRHFAEWVTHIRESAESGHIM